MKKSIQIALALAGALTFSQAINAAEVTSIAPFGEDGEDSFYQVACSNKTVGSVAVHAKPKQICAHPPWAEKRCQPTWTVEAAAAYACR